MHAENSRNVIKKARYRKELSERISREFKLVDCKLRRTNLKDKRSDTIHAVLNVLIRIRIQRMLNEKIRILNVMIIVLNEWFQY